MTPAPDAVTVIIPTRDRWSLLERTLIQLRRQDHDAVSILVVDDASSDDIAARCGRLGVPHLKVVRRGESGGPGRARNEGVRLAETPWVAFLDDDDLWAPAKLPEQLAAARAADAAWCYSSAVNVTPQGEVLDVFPAPQPSDLLEHLLRRNALAAGASNVIVRTELVRELGGFDTRLNHLDDWDLWIRLADRATAASVPEIHVGRLLHAGNRVNTESEGLMAELRELAAKHADLSRRMGTRFDAVEFSRWVGSGHLRGGRRASAARCYLETGVKHRSPGNVLRAAGALALGAHHPATRASRPQGRELPRAPAWLSSALAGAAS